MNENEINKKALEDFLKIFDQRPRLPIPQVDDDKKTVKSLQDMILQMIMRPIISGVAPTEMASPETEPIHLLKQILNELNGINGNTERTEKRLIEITSIIVNMKDNEPKEEPNGPKDTGDGVEDHVVEELNSYSFDEIFQLMPQILGVMDNYLINRDQ